MISYSIKELKSILFITLLLFPFMYSCGNTQLDTTSNSLDATSSENVTSSGNTIITGNVLCDYEVYGDECYDIDKFVLVRKDEVKPEYIKSGASIGGIHGTLKAGEGTKSSSSYTECSADGSTGCITTDTYKALNVSNHVSKIVSTQNIFGVEGKFVVPNANAIFEGTHYGVNDSLTGSLPYCNENGSGCYLRSYSEGESGYQLKAINYDDLYSKRSNIKKGYTLLNGIVGTQSECTAGSSDCYINGNTFTAVESSNLIASNIKTGVSLGSVEGTYSVAYPNCNTTNHTECLAVVDFPSVPSTIRSSLLSSASINGTPGEISDCSSGGSLCYINGNTLKAAETSLLISSNIKKNVSIAGVSGDYPSSSSSLSGATNTSDLTSSNFNSSIISDESFEWFDSAGNRYTGTGDSDLIPENLRNGISVFGVTGSYGDPLP